MRWLQRPPLGPKVDGSITFVRRRNNSPEYGDDVPLDPERPFSGWRSRGEEKNELAVFLPPTNHFADSPWVAHPAV